MQESFLPQRLFSFPSLRRNQCPSCFLASQIFGFSQDGRQKPLKSVALPVFLSAYGHGRDKFPRLQGRGTEHWTAESETEALLPNGVEKEDCRCH